MVYTAESKQDQSRHFGFKQKARSSTSLVEEGSKRLVSKRTLSIPSRHVSRKDLFYGRKARSVQNLRKSTFAAKVTEEEKEFWRESKSFAPSNIKIPEVMHPEEVQISRPVEGLGEEKNVKPQEILEDEIDVVEVEVASADFVIASGVSEELNGNGFHKENGHSLQHDADKSEIPADGKVQADTNTSNGADVKSVLRLKSSRRNSTSSRSSSVSSARSLKQQLPMALQMEVSVDDDGGENMEPLIIGGAAEDLEVSLSVSHDEADDGITTDSETVQEPQNDLDDFEEDASLGSEPDLIVKKSKPAKSVKAGKAIKSPAKPKAESKVRQEKVKTPRTKSLKLKSNKPSPKVSAKILDDDTENSDTNSVSKDDTESDDLNIKSHKSPPKQVKSTPSKQELVDDAEIDEKSGAAPRRSSRTRQTPQKYNSSLYVESLWDEERLNNSDAGFNNSIRSVRGRRSLRKSRNISALNSSLHNESSPWDNDFKVLTPCGGGISVHNASVVDNVDSNTPLKRKAEDENEEENDRGQKKMCVENTDMDNSTSSQTSSFFSVITSPLVMLKNKWRGSSVSSSTPIKDIKTEEKMEVVAPADFENEENTAAEQKDAAVPEINDNVAAPLVEPAVAEAETRSWCTIM